MNYLGWNTTLAKHFFNERHSQTRVFLYTSEELLAEIGDGCEDFLAAMREGYGLVQELGLTPWEGAAKWVDTGWRRLTALPTDGFPPYIAYLALFVLAAGHGNEDEFDSHSYYARLNDLLGPGYPQASSHRFGVLPPVWKDLEAWTVQDQRGALGVFRAQVLGGMEHVGYPRAQLLLNEAERETVERTFASAGLMPRTPVTADELVAIVLKHGKARLRPVTLRRLRSHPGAIPESTRALKELIEDLFDSWEGESGPLERRKTSEGVVQKGEVRLAFSIERSSNPPRLHFHLRVRVPKRLPDDGMLLVGAGTHLLCEPFYRGWSEALVDDNGPADGASIAWGEDITFKSDDNLWRLHMPTRDVRVFISSEQAGFAGPWYVEPDRVVPGVKALIASRDDSPARHGCIPVEVRGLPAGWILYRADQGLSSAAIQELMGYAAPTKLRVRLEGGISHGRSTYFRFAPPAIVVEGEGLPDIAVAANGIPLGRVREETRLRVYSLKDALVNSAKGAVVIQVASMDGAVHHNREIYLHDHVEWPPRWTPKHLNRFGSTVETGGIVGASAPAIEAPLGYVHLQLPLFSERRVYLIGRRPGEIVKWPQESLPHWDAVWAIPLERRGEAVFVGDRGKDLSPGAVASPPPRRDLKAWCDVLYYNRRRITPPRDPSLAGLWKSYVNAAGNACS